MPKRASSPPDANAARVTRVRFALSALALTLLAACGQGVPPQQNYAVVVGRAIDSATNQPVAGVQVTVAAIFSQTTGPDGTFRLANVPLGSETLTASAPAGYTVQAPFSSGYNFSVAAGQILSIDIPLTKQ